MQILLQSGTQSGELLTRLYLKALQRSRSQQTGEQSYASVPSVSHKSDSWVWVCLLPCLWVCSVAFNLERLTTIKSTKPDQPLSQKTQNMAQSWHNFGQPKSLARCGFGVTVLHFQSIYKVYLQRVDENRMHFTATHCFTKLLYLCSTLLCWQYINVLMSKVLALN